MNINSIKKLKGYLYDDSDDKYLDLSESPIKDIIHSELRSLYVVTADTEMRLDLISLKYYGTTSYIDIICEINGIFNPFSVKAGDVLFIPEINSDEDVYVGTEDENDNLRDQFTDTDRLSTADEDRIYRLKELAKGVKGGVSSPLPPNMVQEGEQNNVLKDGKIWLGTQATTKK